MTKRKDGTWQESITVNGKRKYFYGKTKAEVLRKISSYKETGANGLLFSEVADMWDTEHREEVSYNAHRAYSMPYKTAVEKFGNTPIKKITAQEINVYIKRLSAQGFAKRTVKSYLSLLSLVFTFGLKNGYCDNNPASAISVPSNLKTTKRTLPAFDDVETVKKSVSCHFGLFAFFLLYTGCRRGEALALRYEDIDFKNKTISINKSLYWESNKPIIKEPKTAAGTRTIVLLDALAEKLPKGKGYVFGGETPMTQTAFKYHWKKYTEESGIEFTPHQLRHLFATILYECNIDEKVAQTLMGHSSIRVTKDVYTHIREQQIQKAAEALNKLIVV